ncbi:replication initiation protein [Hymenobacter elongatus]|uniref:RepB family plasmid replication initiator protein n=1 Tax=Hymenobacter elongatus TaxID=877208 RepID=A0A4Z0PFA5_9BACT|nr:replication initiation protein [Hymenobacter elongatus]TGE13818.1 RepB family plasmid replication initiator protein [Hymenobacter elongatus]
MDNNARIVAQHNALINARFSFEPLQMRLFLSLLARIEYEDSDFKEHVIPIREIFFQPEGGSAYHQIDVMCKKLSTFAIYIEKLEPGTRKRSKKPHFEYIPLLAKAEYRGDNGGVVAIFNPLIMPYLLQLRQSGNFTTATLAELRKLKSPYALRIYWLLKEYATFGERTMTLQQLRFILDIAENEYPRFSSFKARVLDKAKRELATTDMPFNFETERRNQIVQRIKFLIEHPEKVENSEMIKDVELTEQTEHLENIESTYWQQKLLDAGVSKRSLEQIAQQLAAREYTLDYVEFVLNRITKQKALGKVKRAAGAIYKALAEKYLLAEFLEAQTKPVSKRAAKAQAPTPEVVVRLAEVQEMFANPGPFLKKILIEETFEEHVQRLYLVEGFQLETRGGEDWLVKGVAQE